MRKMSFYVFGSLVAMMASSLLSPAAATCPTGSLSVTNHFNNGTTADADEVNANFSDLTTCAAPLASPAFNGTVGIGAAVTSGIPLNMYLSSNGSILSELKNDSSGASAEASYRVNNGNYQSYFGIAGHSFSTASWDIADLTYWYTNSTAGISIVANGSGGPIRFYSGGTTESGRWGSDRSFLVNTTTNGGWTGSAYLESKATAGTAYAVSAYNNTSSGSALLSRIDNSSGSFLSLYYSTTAIATFNSNGSNVQWNGTGNMFVISGGSGGVSLSNGATSWAAVSDERMKNWAIPQTNYRSAIQDLWVGDYRLYRNFAKSDAYQNRFGVRAQQAYSVLPSDIRDMAVNRGDAKNPWTVSSEPFAYLALWGVKDIYEAQRSEMKRVSDLEAHAELLDKEVADLVQVNSDLRADLQSLRKQLMAANGRRNLKTARN